MIHTSYKIVSEHLKQESILEIFWAKTKNPDLCFTYLQIE